MARVKFSGLISAMSGKIGGSIFGQGPAGNFLRANSYSQQPNSNPQQRQRNKIFIASQMWRTLSETEKQGYKDEVNNYPYLNKFGETVYRSGYALFLFLSNNLLLVDQQPSAIVPTFVPVTTPVINYLENRTTELIYAWDENHLFSRQVLYATRSLQPNQIPKARDFINIGFIPADNPSKTFDITSLYTAKFGTPADFSEIYIKAKMVIISSGNSSVWSNTVKSTMQN